MSAGQGDEAFRGWAREFHQALVARGLTPTNVAGAIFASIDQMNEATAHDYEAVGVGVACYFDNPETMRREMWRNGRCYTSWPYDCVEGSPYPWTPGKVHGKAAAMPAPRVAHADTRPQALRPALPLSSRLRAGIECAPWVLESVREMEQIIATLHKQAVPKVAPLPAAQGDALRIVNTAIEVCIDRDRPAMAEDLESVRHYIEQTAALRQQAPSVGGDRFVSALAEARRIAPNGQGGEPATYCDGWRAALAYIAQNYDAAPPKVGETVAEGGGAEAVRQAWAAAITLGNNICAQESDRVNDEDGDTGWIEGTAECAKRIRGYHQPVDAALIEMLTEAGADAAIAALAPTTGARTAKGEPANRTAMLEGGMAKLRSAALQLVEVGEAFNRASDNGRGRVCAIDVAERFTVALTLCKDVALAAYDPAKGGEAVTLRPVTDDTARLNWLATNPRPAEMVIDGQRKACVFWGISAHPDVTLREAIDAAIPVVPAGGKEAT